MHSFAYGPDIWLERRIPAFRPNLNLFCRFFNAEPYWACSHQRENPGFLCLKTRILSSMRTLSLLVLKAAFLLIINWYIPSLPFFFFQNGRYLSSETQLKSDTRRLPRWSRRHVREGDQEGTAFGQCPLARILQMAQGQSFGERLQVGSKGPLHIWLKKYLALSLGSCC